MTSTGTTPPRHIHYDYELAVAEAKRLHSVHNCDVLILEIKNRVTTKSVPVYEDKIVVLPIEDGNDDLPF